MRLSEWTQAPMALPCISPHAGGLVASGGPPVPGGGRRPTALIQVVTCPAMRATARRRAARGPDAWDARTPGRPLSCQHGGVVGVAHLHPDDPVDVLANVLMEPRFVPSKTVKILAADYLCLENPKIYSDRSRHPEV